MSSKSSNLNFKDMKTKPMMTQQYAKQLLNLQQLYHSKFLTTQLLNQMVSLYVFAVQCFDQKYSPMRSYFLGKIQQVLSRPQITKLLQGVSEEDQKVRETIRMSGYLSMSQIQPQFNDRQFNRKNNHQKQQVQFGPQKLNINDQVKTKQRNMKIQMQMKVMRQVQQNMKNITKQVQNRNKKQEETDKQINKAIESQQNMLNQRLAKRRKKLRKKSADDNILKADKDKDQPQEPQIKVEQLKQVQKELDQAVERFTLRMTQKMIGLLNNPPSASLQNSQQRGKVKIGRVQQQDQDLQLQQEKQIVPNLIATSNMKKNKQSSNNNYNNKKQQTLTQKIKKNQVKQSQAMLMKQQDQEKNKKQRENPTERIGTVHDPMDKGRVTMRNRNQQDSDQESNQSLEFL